MSQIYVNHIAVQSAVSDLRSRLSSQISGVVSQYSSVPASLNVRYDSLTNASYRKVSEEKKRKAESSLRGLTKLLNFIAGSAEQMRLTDMRLSRIMQTESRHAG